MQYKTELDKLRHSCSHVLAQAVQELWPGTKLAIGPAIDNGFYYDFDKPEPFSEEDLKKIEERMAQIIRRDPPFRQKFLSKEDALRLFRERGERYKVDILEHLPDETVSIYETGDEWFDLCKGPHVQSAGQIKAFKLLNVAGAYWRGDETQPMLQRIYGTAFFDPKDLDAFLKQLDEAKRRDHRRLGQDLDLFHIYHEEAGAGLVFYHPAGATMRGIIEDYIREQNIRRGYQPVITPHLLKGKLWEISGHAEHYRDNMYYLNVDGEEYAVKPMNCPGHILIYRSKVRSYRELPLRLFELGTVYRREKAGVLHGLLRVRGFTQDDAHIFCRPQQIQEEVEAVLAFVFDCMADFGFDELLVELSTRPQKHIGSIADWDQATQSLTAALEARKLKYEINEGEGAFYGPKIDVKLKDAIGRSWQCATIQCDFALPERFGLEFIDEAGRPNRPIMIHRAVLGSIERFMGTLIEHYAGAFPPWLAPVQAVVVPIQESHKDWADEVLKALKQQGVRVILDARNESLGKRVREHTVKKVPFVLIIGDQEVRSRQVAVRQYGAGDRGLMGLDAFISLLTQAVAEKGRFRYETKEAAVSS